MNHGDIFFRCVCNCGCKTELEVARYNPAMMEQVDDDPKWAVWISGRGYQDVEYMTLGELLWEVEGEGSIEIEGQYGNTGTVHLGSRNRRRLQMTCGIEAKRVGVEIVRRDRWEEEE